MIDFGLIFENTLSGILINLPYFILFIWGVKTIAKQMPHWLDVYNKNKLKELALSKAVGIK